MDPQLANPFSKTAPDLRPSAASPALNAANVAPKFSDSFFVTANYVGAFDSTNDWMAGWTSFANPGAVVRFGCSSKGGCRTQYGGPRRCVGFAARISMRHTAFSARGPRPLSNAAASPEELIIRSSMQRRETTFPRSKNLRITKDEFCGIRLARASREQGTKRRCDFAWDQATLKSLSGLTRLLDQHRGRKYEFISLRYPGPPEHHESIVVHKAPTVSLRDEKGIVHEVRISGSSSRWTASSSCSASSWSRETPLQEIAVGVQRAWVTENTESQ